MNFFLKYDGPLKSNDHAQGKHQIRQCFRAQLERLWSILPLKECKNYLTRANTDKCVLKKIAGVEFAPLVTTALFLTCELDITMLWGEEAGNIVGNSGDIDNRLKTLFDALACPDENQIATIRGNDPNSFPEPYLCLLEDDKLITSVNVRTSCLLEYDPDLPYNVSVLVNVITRPYRSAYCNVGL